MAINKKLRFFLNYFVGPVLFVVMMLSIFRQVKKQEDWHQSWMAIRNSFVGAQSWKLYAVMLLMLLNWGIEARKWQVLLRHVNPLPFSKAFRSVLSGVAFTVITPNRMGEFIGRVFYIAEGQRIRAATLTVVGSMSQMLVTLLAGLISLIAIRSNLLQLDIKSELSYFWVNGLMYITILVLLLLTIFYFRLSWAVRLAEKFPSLQKTKYFIALLDEVKTKELLHILSLSMLRFLVFTSQYMLLFNLFSVQIPFWQGCCAVGVLFLILVAIPLPGLAELGVRGKASVALFGLFSKNIFGITVCAGSIWLINIILPAFLGSLLILNVKLFNKTESLKKTEGMLP